MSNVGSCTLIAHFGLGKLVDNIIAVNFFSFLNRELLQNSYRKGIENRNCEFENNLSRHHVESMNRVT